MKMPDKLSLYIIALAIIIVLDTAHILWNSYRIDSFMGQGARFTLDNGRELCERIQRLEEKNYLMRKDCDFSTDK